MEVKVFITRVFPVEKIVSKKDSKEYLKYKFLGETFDQFPKKILFNLFNPKEGTIIPKENDNLVISFDAESRSNVSKDGVERWFTDLNVWKIMPNTDSNDVVGPSTQPQNVPQHQQQVQQHQPVTYNQPQPAPVKDDLPF